jgi:hypothetical protein
MRNQICYPSRLECERFSAGSHCVRFKSSVLQELCIVQTNRGPNVGVHEGHHAEATVQKKSGVWLELSRSGVPGSPLPRRAPASIVLCTLFLLR